MNISPIIQVEDLIQLQGHDDLVIVDVTFGPEAKANYEKGHLEGALFVDLNSQLSDIKDDVSVGGRHPLPTPMKFSEMLSRLGISPHTHVILYDNNSGASAAARFWWMLKAFGHDQVQVIDGGLQEAGRKGFPINSKKVIPKQAVSYPECEWRLPLSWMQEVEYVLQDNRYTVIDVRDKARYEGIHEPIDLVAGHIPGAINVPFTHNLDDKGLFKSPSQLKAIYQSILGEAEASRIIVHCGSGVTACHTLLAMSYAGLEIPKLYVGSWSEWSRNNKPMITKESS